MPKRKSHIQSLPTLFVGLSVLLVLLGIIVLIDPAVIAEIPPKHSFAVMHLLMFLSTFFLSSYAFLNTRRGVLIATGVTLFLILSQLRIFTILHGIILVLALLSIELLLTAKR